MDHLYLGRKLGSTYCSAFTSQRAKKKIANKIFQSLVSGQWKMEDKKAEDGPNQGAFPITS